MSFPTDSEGAVMDSLKSDHSLIHSFWRLIWRLFKRLLLRGAPSPATDKKEGLERDVKFGRVGHQHGTQHSAHSRTRKTGYRNTIKKKLKPMKISLTSGVTTPGQLRAVSGLNLFLPGCARPENEQGLLCLSITPNNILCLNLQYKFSKTEQEDLAGKWTLY